MRPGLVAVGAAFALVGAGVILAVLWTEDAPTVPRSSTVAIDNLGAGNPALFTLNAAAAAYAQITLHWIASANVSVNWYLTVSCQSSTGWCIESAPAATWPSGTSGSWSHSGTAISVYVLAVQDASTSSVNFSASFLEKYQPAPLALPLLPLGIVLTGGSLLAGTGAVVLYLGLFLPSGVYSPLDSVSDEFLYGGLDERIDEAERTRPP